MAGRLVGGGIMGLLRWLAPVALLLLAGGTLVSVSMDDSVGGLEDLSSIGWLGYCLVALAAAAFFGPGTTRSIVRVLSGQGGLWDLLFMRQSIISALISLGALLLAVFCLVMAVTGGALFPG